MVFGEMASRIDDYLWYPKLMLPVMDSLLMMMGPDEHMAEIDVGEMFYNLDYIRCWRNNVEWTWDLIWFTRGTGKEHHYGCAG